MREFLQQSRCLVSYQKVVILFAATSSRRTAFAILIHIDCKIGHFKLQCEQTSVQIVTSKGIGVVSLFIFQVYIISINLILPINC